MTIGGLILWTILSLGFDGEIWHPAGALLEGWYSFIRLSVLRFDSPLKLVFDSLWGHQIAYSETLLLLYIGWFVPTTLLLIASIPILFTLRFYVWLANVQEREAARRYAAHVAAQVAEDNRKRERAAAERVKQQRVQALLDDGSVRTSLDNEIVICGTGKEEYLFKDFIIETAYVVTTFEEREDAVRDEFGRALRYISRDVPVQYTDIERRRGCPYHKSSLFSFKNPILNSYRECPDCRYWWLTTQYATCPKCLTDRTQAPVPVMHDNPSQVSFGLPAYLSSQRRSRIEALEWILVVLIVGMIGLGLVIVRSRQTTSSIPSSLLTGHTGDIQALAWSPDGTILASGAFGDPVRLWSARGEPLATLSNRGGVLAWSPDGTILASSYGEESNIRLWSARGEPLATLSGPTGAIEKLAWSPDGTILATEAVDGTLRLWSAHGQLLATLTDCGKVLAWSPDGTILASGSRENTVRLWSARGEPLATLSGHTAEVSRLLWSPDGTILASSSYEWYGWDQNIRLWNSRGQLLATLTGARYWLAWSPDGRTLASVSSDGYQIQLWNSRGEPLGTLTDTVYTNLVEQLVWSPDGATLAAISGANVLLWDTAGPRDHVMRPWSTATNPYAVLIGHTEGVNTLAWSPDGTILASGSGDNTIRLWRPNSP